MLSRTISGLFTLLFLTASPAFAADDAARWAPISAEMKELESRHILSGAVTLVASKDKILAVDATGLADIAANTPMKNDSIFAIASMTKLVTGVAVMMLVDEGKISLDDPIGKYVPELAHLKTADGVEHVVTIRHAMTHTSGMGEATKEEAASAHTLADLIPMFAKKPLAFEPGSKWVYCQSGINTAGRIIEIVSHQPYHEFVQKRIFDPLGMKDSTFYPTKDQVARIAKSYKRTKDGKLEEAPTPRVTGHDPALHDYLAPANAGLFSTAPDFARMCQMVLNKGQLDGHIYVKPAAIAQMISNQIGAVESAHVPGSGFGIGWCVIRDPQGQTAPLSPGSAGHGGAYGTLAWVDPSRGLCYILMIQRANFGGKKDNARDAFMRGVGTSLKQ